LTAAFVYPPKWVISSLIWYALYQKYQPPRISVRRRPRHEKADESYRQMEIEVFFQKVI